MFDLRYHVASLAAVFLALIVGIVVGVGLAGSGVTKETDLKLARAQRDAALHAADSRLTKLNKLGKTEKTYEQAFQLAYPAVMRDLLKGKRVAVLFVGPVDGGVSQAIETTLRDSGAVGEAPIRVISLSLPVSPKTIDNVLVENGPQFSGYVGDTKLGGLGSALGAELESGGQTPLWKMLGSLLIGERHGSSRPPADAIVVARTVDPQQGATARFLHGLYTGIAASDVPAVGVEESNTTPSAASTFRDRGLSSVDDIDQPTGRVALALLLAGAPAGRYGTGDGVDGVLPTVPSG